MKYFEKYTSNTVAGTSNQSYFVTESEEKVYTARLFYKLFAGGKYSYSFLISNITDSTFSDGSHSRKNRIVDSWTITKMGYALIENYSQNTVNQISDVIPLSFDSAASKTVAPGEFAVTDEVVINANAGDFLCIEISFCGREIPCHPESIIPTFILTDSGWKPSKNLPHISMIGAARSVKSKVAFWGDSITQGIGTPENSYKHWNARLGELLGSDYSFWNLGIGFARAEDAASFGAWFYKAKQADTLVLCFGVNDIMQGRSPEAIKSDILHITKKLKSLGKKVLVQTTPPFDYNPEQKACWCEVNDFIKNELSVLCDAVFDTVPVLGLDCQHPECARYGGHPNPDGCTTWADALYPVLKSIL